MKDDYLWDRSGEPDTEVAQLEELFRELRFDETAATPPPFKLSVVPIRKRFSFPLRIAAGLCFLLLAGAIAVKLGGWSRSRTPSMTKPVATVDDTTPSLPSSIQGPGGEIELGQDQTPSTLTVSNGKAKKKNLQLHKAKYSVNSRTAKIREGERAKAELMEAFRIASATLNQVQQKLAVNKDVGPSS
jgi:hypothetical protein